MSLRILLGSPARSKKERKGGRKKGRERNKKRRKRWYLKNNALCLGLRKKSPKTKKNRTKQKLETSLQIELDINKSLLKSNPKESKCDEDKALSNYEDS